MSADFVKFFACPKCDGRFSWNEKGCSCGSCKTGFQATKGIVRFVSGTIHDNFAIQWKKFADVQLDSRNRSACSRDRLLDQSGMRPEDFSGKDILEVGCGAGRFTEILLGFGANVIAVDYSEAVEACADSNKAFREKGRLFNAQADVFSLPLKDKAFDIVVGFGMLQHTGNARKALECLWARVKPGGTLLVDRYQLSLRSTHPLKYALRPVFKFFSPLAVLKMAETTCYVLVPIQRFLLKSLRGGGINKYMRYILNRSLNSTYPINLEIEGKIDKDTAYRWSILDTFDMWAPKYDEPATFTAWKRELEGLANGEVIICKSGGQGNVGVVRRRV
jgi:2-polyprenyl-3-methyl-5-hydroxy-6-metoxy-1,4-benzoquinol methylase